MEEARGPQASGALEVGIGTEEMLESERRARAAAERNADRLARLARVATGLSSAATERAVAEVIVAEAMAAMGADSGGIWMIDPSGTRLELLLISPTPPADMKQRISSYGIETENPLCHAVRTQEGVWVESWQEFARRFPASEARVAQVPPPRPTAFGCLPLRYHDKILGGLAFSFFRPHRFDEEDRAFISLLAHHCAQGMERARLYEQALEAVRVREDFLSVAGHELRTPLSALVLQTELMLAAAGDAALARARSEPILRTVRRLSKLADELLEVSRLRAGRLQIDPERVELTSLVRDVATCTAQSATPPPSELRIEAPQRIEGHWDPLRLEQIVTNLVANACKYGRGKPVDVRVAVSEGAAHLSVRDQGIGISPADQARIFERFSRAVAPGSFSGLGLGLWIVREIVRAHGGQISVRSERGQGAEFIVVLPLEPPSDP
jgi:signal transduction histidine kinase